MSEETKAIKSEKCRQTYYQKSEEEKELLKQKNSLGNKRA